MGIIKAAQRSINLSEENILKELLKTETLIKQTCFLTPLPLQKSFKIVKGKYPILLSAPHSARTVRNGGGRARENYVGSFVNLISRTCKTYGIYADTVSKDPNFYYKTKYKKEIEQLIKNEGIKIFIDFHGAGRRHDFEIDIGTYNGKSLLGRKEIVSAIKRNLKKKGFRKISENFFTRRPNTLTGFIHRLDIPTIQIEINKNNRYLKTDKDNTVRMVKALIGAIEEIKKILEKKDGIR